MTTHGTHRRPLPGLRARAGRNDPLHGPPQAEVAQALADLRAILAGLDLSDALPPLALPPLALQPFNTGSDDHVRR